MGTFDRWTDRDIVDLVEAYPLAIVVGCAGAGAVTPLPMMIETDPAGRPQYLVGHFARHNRQVEQVRANPRTQFLFMGPQGYISPGLLTKTRNWAPTWNYAFVRIVADVAFDETLTDEAITRVVGKMEHGREQPWTAAEMGERYDLLKVHVIAFRALIIDIEARFKLGQDERPENFSDIVEGSDEQLASWMRRFNMRD